MISTLRSFQERVIVEFLRFLTHPLWRTVSIVEFIVILVCLLASIGVIVNGWNIYRERKRAHIGNGAKLTLSEGSWRRVFSDGFQIFCYFGIGVVFAIAPNATTTPAQSRAAAATLLLLGILAAMLYNQVNDYLTRRKATIQLDELYERTHRIELSRIED